jgi:hypothetical protein
VVDGWALGRLCEAGQSQGWVPGGGGGGEAEAAKAGGMVDSGGLQQGGWVTAPAAAGQVKAGVGSRQERRAEGCRGARFRPAHGQEACLEMWVMVG